MGATKVETSYSPSPSNNVDACKDGKQINVRMEGSSVENQACERDQLKTKLKSLLAKHGGSTKHPDIISTIKDLGALNPVGHKALQSPMFCGTFVALTSPNFPGRHKSVAGEQDIVQYTLGRLSFNIFQPRNLLCTLRNVRNPVIAQATAEKEDRDTFSYSFILDITIHTPEGDLPAVLVNEGYCYENKEIDNRLMVTFTGGTLMPADEVKNDTSKMKLWCSTFEGAYKKAEEERSYVGRFFQSVVKALLGLTLPNDDSSTNLSFHFGMKRSPAGHFEVLYLDEDLRITRGNRGTIVVVERCRKVGDLGQWG
jgi:hypothetical protein